MLCDGHNGMGGVSCEVSQHLADEFSSKDVISFPVIPPHFKAENIDISSHCLSSLIQVCLIGIEYKHFNHLKFSLLFLVFFAW